MLLHWDSCRLPHLLSSVAALQKADVPEHDLHAPTCVSHSTTPSGHGPPPRLSLPLLLVVCGSPWLPLVERGLPSLAPDLHASAPTTPSPCSAPCRCCIVLPFLDFWAFCFLLIFCVSLLHVFLCNCIWIIWILYALLTTFTGSSDSWHPYRKSTGTRHHALPSCICFLRYFLLGCLTLVCCDYYYYYFSVVCSSFSCI
jgi:hypothetical protein